LRVPASGRFEWHVGPSTRPWVGAAGRREAWIFTCESPTGEVVVRRDVVVERGETATFADACSESGAVDVTRTSPDRSRPAVVEPPRGFRLIVGRQRVWRSTLRRRGYARVVVRLRGSRVRRARLRLVDADRTVRASRRVKLLKPGRTRLRLRLPHVPRPALYRLVLRGTASNGAHVGASARLRILRR
jgi:hypothetical protein